MDWVAHLAQLDKRAFAIVCLSGLLYSVFFALSCAVKTEGDGRVLTVVRPTERE